MSNRGNIIRFQCGHRRTVKNTDHRDSCAKCSQKGLQNSPTRRRPTTLSSAEATQALAYLADGRSQSWVAAAFGVSQSAINRLRHGDVKAHAKPLTFRLPPILLPSDLEPPVDSGRSYSTFPPKRQSA